MNESEEPQLTISILPYTDNLLNNEVTWHRRGGWSNHNKEIDTLIVGKLGAENVVYMLCDGASMPRRIFYIETKQDYKNKRFATQLLEYFLKNFAVRVDVEASSPTSPPAKTLLDRFGFVPLGNSMWWVRKKN